ncbi:MAG: hypothetical protein NTV49_07515 [Kiritimatiellaeota bacterium]|nr:hypothetical protein [Kiritimatiellota bacterium]
MKQPVRRALLVMGVALCIPLAWAALGAGLGLLRDDVSVQVRQTTGVHTRLVWCEQAEGDGRDVGANGAQLRLMGLDTDDRLGIHPILGTLGNVHKPMITPEGERIVFSDLIAGTIRVINWNGACLRDLGPGRAVALWMDPGDRTEWVYAFSTGNVNADGAGQPLIRFRLDNPFRKETVWDLTPVTTDNIRLSADGTCLGALFPWPLGGVANPATLTWRELGRGCWPSLAPDNSYLLWIFDGAHRNVSIHTPDGKTSWTVKINDAPGIAGSEVYHPRWSNHIRFFCMSGPYRAGSGSNQIRAGGAGVEIHLGRLDDKLQSVESWVRVTNNKKLDVYPDVWVDSPSAAFLAWKKSALRVRDTLPDGNPVAPLVVRARLMEKTATPSLDAIAPYRQALVVYRYTVETILAGTEPARQILVAHWGLVHGKEKRLDQRTGELYELKLEPYARRKELEGERVVMDIKDYKHPLYYAVEHK